MYPSASPTLQSGKSRLPGRIVKPLDIFALAAYVRAAAERTAPDRRRRRLEKTR